MEKELYALVDAVKRFEYYLVGTNFEVFTDPRVLLYLRKAKESNPKLYRWSLVLQRHSFTITRLSSARNLVADMLSRTTNEEGQEKARQLSMTKKDLLDRYKRETEQCFIPEGSSMSAKQVVQLLQDPYLTVNLSTPSWTREDMMKILLENMEDKEEVMERLYQEGPARLPPIQDDFVCKMISCQAESDPEVESEIPGLASASYKAMGISLVAFANLQLNDDYCQEIRETMGNKGMKWLFAEIDGLLVRLPPSIHSKKGLKARLTPNTPRAVVPDVLIDLLIDRVHYGPSRAHVGASRLLATLTKKYFFKMIERVQARIAACLPCQLSMYTTRTAHELHPTSLESVPRRSVAIDLAVDFPKCMGWVQIMVFVDLATNFVTLKPLKSKTLKELTERFGEYMAAYGVLSLVRHDQEKGLTGGAFKELCEELGIEQVLGLPNNPQTNGRVQAQVRNVKYALKSLTLAQGSKGKWPKELWKVQLALNTSVSRLTHQTPELMMFGHEAEKNCYDLVSLTSVEAPMSHGTPRLSRDPATSRKPSCRS